MLNSGFTYSLLCCQSVHPAAVLPVRVAGYAAHAPPCPTETYKYSSDFDKLSSLLGSTEAVLSTMLSAAVPEWRKQTAVAATASGSTADPWVTASAGALDMARMDSDAEPAPGSHSRASTGQVSSGHVAGSASAGGQEAAAGEGGSGGVNEDSATPAAHATGPCTSAVSGQQQQSAQQVRFPGLLTDLDRMNFVIAMLEREYESVYARQGELDERDFLSMDFNTMASPK